ncbi:DEAD/DEAH box helicase [Paenibacillus cellulositrophicus]|uniref:helicase-related protein n=1 Tax=Paenibacillus cellulositrophicus TaxID=562959 RepID=UPI00203C8500|nr:helicase-related protein [Paenibacillus cellulositrophicus]MCM3000722.1 DEAD/DEAH box helicase [Paenibacillus cellulositrophicus]
MRVAVYAIRQGQRWRMKISLDLRIDIVWWEYVCRNAGVNGTMVLLSGDMPLGWACKVARGFMGAPEMMEWKMQQWRGWLEAVLREEMEREQTCIGRSRPGKDGWTSVGGERQKGVLWGMQDQGGGVWNGFEPKDHDGAARGELRAKGCGGAVRDGFKSKGRDGLARGGFKAKGHGRATRDGFKFKDHDVAVGDGFSATGYDGSAGDVFNTKGNDRNVGNDDSGMWRWELGEPLAPAVWQELMRQPEEGRWAGDVRDPAVLRVLAEQAAQLVDRLHGRSLLAAEVDSLLSDRAPGLAGAWHSAAQLAYLQGQLALDAGVAAAGPRKGPRGALRAGRGQAPRCRRCGSEATGRTACAACGLAACAYCEACLALGRSRACSLLLRTAADPAVRGTAGESTAAVARRWGLSAAQGDAAWAALGFLAEPPGGGSAAGGRTGWMRPRWGAARRSGTNIAPSRFLLWAVTGAGKTEMIFPLLDSVLAVGGRVLVATPRRDVVLELAPRLAKAFSGVRIVTLYGGSAERWESGALTLATTHQLMRFYHAFDLVVIDELDAFPYHNDPMLAYAAQHACKTDGKFVYLSATPPRPLQREVSRGTLPHAKVPVRYHGHPLPVPKRIVMRSVETCLRQPKLLGPLAAELRRSIDRGAQIFLFVSRIRHIGPLVEILRRRFKDISVEGTSSEDSGRGEKVMAFRKKDIRLLVTTTILERGVTVPRSDVYILDADSSLFDEASLVQMAGRAGRSSEDPAGRVIFASSQWTLSQKLAVNQIKAMNRIAGKHGYLKEQPSKS